MADNRNTLTDEILVLAETLGDIKARFERVESEFETQSKPLEAALAALSAAMTGIKTLQHHVLDNSLSALSLKVEEQRKAIDEQITVIVGELKGADAQNSEKIALQTAELKQQFSEISANVNQLAAQFEGQLKRVELEAQEKLTKFAAVPGPQGPAGASINPRGNWIDGVTYNRLDVVSLLGTSYISAVDNNTSKPARNGDKWTVLARAGTGGGGAANFGSLAGVAEINQGGTGQTTALLGARALLDGISTTTGDILYRGSSGWTSLTAGAADTVLKSQGSGAAPQWAATSSATAATDAQAAAGTSTTTFVTPANAKYAAAPVVNARAPRQGLVFDGTAGATVSVPAFGTKGWTQAFWVYQTQIRGGGQLTYLTGSNGAAAPNVAFLDTTNELIVYNGSSAFYSGYIVPTGKWLNIVVTNDGTTTKFYSNGIQVGSSADSTNYSGTLVAIGSNGSTNSWLYGALSGCFIYNRALSASEVVALYEAGAPSGADYNNASNTSLITGDNSTFASDTGYWTKSGSVTIGGGNATFSAGGAFLRRDILTGGKRFRLTVVITANTAADGLIIYNGGTNLATYNTTGTKVLEIAASTAASPANSLYLYQAGAGGVTVDTVTLEPLGLLLAPDAAQAGGGLTWNDTSGNGAHIVLPATGVDFNLPSYGQRIVSAKTSTNGNEKLLGANSLGSVNGRGRDNLVRAYARARTGTPTVTLGWSAGNAGIVASVTLSGGGNGANTWQPLTLITTYNTGVGAAAIWAGSNSTDIVDWMIVSDFTPQY